MDVRSLRVLVFVLVVGTAASVRAAADVPAPAFPDSPKLTLEPPRFSDHAIARLIATLDALLHVPGSSTTWGAHAEIPLNEFVRRLQAGTLTPAQEGRVVAHLDLIARLHPRDRALVAASRTAVRLLRVGKAAPDIVAKDLDGRDLKLSDYRGQVVLLMFSADWCAICRTQEPYERLLQELYKNWPFAIVSVETGQSPAVTKRAKGDAQLKYRSWWDAAVNGHVGSIAGAWNVVGFPRTFLIDRAGLIRFVDVRDEDLLKAVRQLLDEDEVVAGPGTRHDAVGGTS